MNPSHFSLGNPVDSWWNGLRPRIRQSVERLASSPAFDAPEKAEERFATATAHYEYVQQAPYPPQAEVARQHLLDSLESLCASLHWQSQSDYDDSDKAYERAYYNFVLFTHILLQRGIYEPDPTTLQRKI